VVFDSSPSGAHRPSCDPSALLRSERVGQVTNRARAHDNHAPVIGANASRPRPGRTMISVGNSTIATPIAEVSGRASSHECRSAPGSIPPTRCPR
jgi:hypothetical protein